MSGEAKQEIDVKGREKEQGSSQDSIHTVSNAVLEDKEINVSARNGKM